MLGVCCCLPCIIALLYAIADQDGASKEDIEHLSKFRFRKVANKKVAGDVQGGGVMTNCGIDSPIEHVISQEDAECCICLSSYDDGVELSLKMALDKVARRILVEFDFAVLVSLVKCTGHGLHPLASLLYGG
ncbi:hypothetical protein C1H46_002666 [Malus baccata]|uniref:RING-type domain-containing protein n=1 Tax=Malus baccata TaxID=106549 RepID=A0A540NM82_MALBA|nr:hypothetical protein C1H46_002666 [Malus baccata]